MYVLCFVWCVQVVRWLPWRGEDVSAAHVHVPRPLSSSSSSSSSAHTRYDTNGHRTTTTYGSTTSTTGYSRISYGNNGSHGSKISYRNNTYGNSSYSSGGGSGDYFGDRHEGGCPPAPGAVGLQNLGNTCFMNR